MSTGFRQTDERSLSDILIRHETEIASAWISEQASLISHRPDLLTETELRQQSRALLSEITSAARMDPSLNLANSAWKATRDLLSEISRSRALAGFSPAETASFVFSLRGALMDRLQTVYEEDARSLAAAMRSCSTFVDQLGLVTTSTVLKTREELIKKQQEEMLELSTPVVRLFDGVLCLPLIGTLDSARTQVVMESLLQKIVETGSTIAIIDITGVPTVDTLVAQHLLKTVSAARLMGAECIVSGIRPQIAQTIVHLGVELHNVATKATLADALALAMQKRGLTIQRVNKQA
ncbi:MAG: STAS domain-containing protein [Bryobacterales bacterium]|nr:STAS domain-containing protein [Bryobacterales bacterium]